MKLKTMILAGMVGAGIATSPMANADQCGLLNPCQPAQPNTPNQIWPGQLQPTWDIPNVYGGWTNDPTFCMNGQCSIYAPNPNGR